MQSWSKLSFTLIHSGQQVMTVQKKDMERLFFCTENSNVNRKITAVVFQTFCNWIMFFMQEEGAWGQSVSRTCLRVSGMWHCGILRLKLRHSAGTSGTAHTPSVHEVPDLACSNTEEQNRDTNAQMSSYSWVFHGYDPLWPFNQCNIT